MLSRSPRLSSRSLSFSLLFFSFLFFCSCFSLVLSIYTSTSHFISSSLLNLILPRRPVSRATRARGIRGALLRPPSPPPPPPLRLHFLSFSICSPTLSICESSAFRVLTPVGGRLRLRDIPDVITAFDDPPD